MVACWLQMQDANYRFGTAREAELLTDLEFGLRRMESAQRRHLAAVKALTAYRKTAAPAAAAAGG